jgi:hypothetical protein
MVIFCTTTYHVILAVLLGLGDGGEDAVLVRRAETAVVQTIYHNRYFGREGGAIGLNLRQDDGRS